MEASSFKKKEPLYRRCIKGKMVPVFELRIQSKDGNVYVVEIGSSGRVVSKQERTQSEATWDPSDILLDDDVPQSITTPRVIFESDPKSDELVLVNDAGILRALRERNHGLLRKLLQHYGLQVFINKNPGLFCHMMRLTIEEEQLNNEDCQIILRIFCILLENGYQSTMDDEALVQSIMPTARINPQQVYQHIKSSREKGLKIAERIDETSDGALLKIPEHPSNRFPKPSSEPSPEFFPEPSPISRSRSVLALSEK
jgi:hypothetical protein